MDDRRKLLGKRIKKARRWAGYRSQAKFADAIGLSESSVANAEIGSERVGMDAYGQIEAGLPQWPDGTIERFLATGDLSLLPEVGEHRPRELAQQPDDRELPEGGLLDTAERKFWAIDELSPTERRGYIYQYRAWKQAATRTQTG